MTLKYEDALQEVLEALRAGDEPEGAMTSFPEHAPALREHAQASEAVTRIAGAVPAVRPEARLAASRRLRAQLEAERSRGHRRFEGPFGSAWAPRFVLVGVVIAVALASAALLLSGGAGTSVEAATIEGVVVDNAGGRLTVQTLDALELVTVPPDTLVSDTGGAAIGLDALSVGQVVVIDVERRGSDVFAERIQRYVDSIQAWCADDSQRCRVLSDQLEQAQRRCETSPRACLAAVERLEPLRQRAVDTARLEELKQACRTGDTDACRQLAGFCREYAEICGDFSPRLPDEPAGPSPLERLRDLDQRCDGGDEPACRRRAELCLEHPGICPTDTPARPADATPAPQATPASGLRPAATATGAVEPPDATPEPADIQPAAPADIRPPAPDGALGPTPAPVRDSQQSEHDDPTPSSGDAAPTPSAEPTESQGDAFQEADASPDRR